MCIKSKVKNTLRKVKTLFFSASDIQFYKLKLNVLSGDSTQKTGRCHIKIPEDRYFKNTSRIDIQGHTSFRFSQKAHLKKSPYLPVHGEGKNSLLHNTYSFPGKGNVIINLNYYKLLELKNT